LNRVKFIVDRPDLVLGRIRSTRKPSPGRICSTSVTC